MTEKVPTAIVEEPRVVPPALNAFAKRMPDFAFGATFMCSSGCCRDDWAIFVDRRIFHPDMLGLIPSFVQDGDERPVIEQINERYAHGGGWRDMEGMVIDLDGSGALVGPSGSRFALIGATIYPSHDTLMLVFESGMTAVVAADASYRVARLD